MQAAIDAQSRGLEGAWLIQVTPEGHAGAASGYGAPDEGRRTGIASNNPPSSGSPGLGVGERTGEHQYREIFETFTFDSSRQPSGLLHIPTETTVGETGDRQSGRAQIYFQPPGS